MRWNSATIGVLLAADCLLVSGRRASADAQVFINDHPVAVEGVRLPLDTLRAWSPSRARTLSVTTADRGGDGAATTQLADLPIGLLGHRIDLAMLTVRVH